MQQLFYQQQQMQQIPRIKKVKKKKNSNIISQSVRRQPGIKTMNSVPRPKQNLSQRPLTAAANKKFKRSRVAINTINHEEDNKKMALDMMNFNPQVGKSMKTSSMRRPQTAKVKKGLSGPKRQANMMGGTPSNQKLGRLGMAGQSYSNNYIVPQQSQMFSSFGMMQHSQSKRKANSNPKKKSLTNYPPGLKPGLSKKKLKQNLSQQKIQKNPKKNPRYLQHQQLLLDQQSQLQNAMVNQNLVEMPILSEEFLNQLNEKQLQDLLEQQQQLMMLQQQNQILTTNPPNEQQQQ